jgi:acyl-CoA dehydrogenase
MNFDLPTDLIELKERTREFIADQVIPLEDDARQDAHGPCEALRRELTERARRAGLLTPHASAEMGGWDSAMLPKPWCLKKLDILG